jgi:NADH:ubiquinone oxidoreductase subunit F (NADH-binding)/NAD-dependent dihydropyrimidine dehydrogenase PreA subunit/(2Fe-2S) ferredoxin
MAFSVVDKCCDKCGNTSSDPCAGFVQCRSEGPFCHEDDKCKSKLSSHINSLKRDDVKKPVLFIGTGTCGLGAGALKTLAQIKSYIKNKGLDVEIIEVGCIGLCSEEPIMDVQLPGKKRVSFSKVTDKNVDKILDAVFAGKDISNYAFVQFGNEKLSSWNNVPLMKEHSFFKNQTRWVLENCGVIDPTSIDEYMAHDGYKALSKALSQHTSKEICDVIEKSGLRGRGGGGFLTGKKWKFALNTESNKKYFVCNADEGDPGAFMDRAVIEGDPHRLLEGLIIASYAIGASTAYVYIRAEYPLAIRRLNKAIDDAKKAGLLGENILDSGFNLDIIIKKGAGAFVCGEETALIHSIEGKRGMPRPRPPYPAVSGLFGKPTVINNVETLANVALIIRNGADWFNAVGTDSTKGTKVFALSGKVNRTGLVEVAMGTSIRDIVYSIGDGIPDNKQFKAVQIGGPSGGCVPTSHIDIQIDYESLKAIGAMMGSGGLVVMDENTCMVDVAKFFMDFIQRESCGKCIPCREGTKRMYEILEKITRGNKSEQGYDALDRFKGVVMLKSLAEVIQDTSLCGLGNSAPNPVLSTLRWFEDEYEAHIFGRTCPAGVCTELISFKIDAEKCKGCTICAKKCPNDAIMGAVKSPHYIVQDKCIKCGACMDACKFSAVIKTGNNEE